MFKEQIKKTNFLIIGAQKAGTTSLYHYLKQHPQIYMSPVKEPHFFTYQNHNFSNQKISIKNKNIITQLSDYERLFEGVKNEIAIGEASPSYIYSEQAPKRIHEFNHDMKIIAILRNPIDRAFSNYLHAIRKGSEPVLDFKEVIKLEKDRIKEGWGFLHHYINKGFYYEQISRYYNLFKKDQIEVFLYEDLQNQPQILINSLFDFLDVNSTFTPDISEKHNTSGIGKILLLIKILPFFQNYIFRALWFKKLFPNKFRKKIKSKLYSRPSLSPDLRVELIDIFREDIHKLENLIARDLSDWLEIKEEL